MLKFGSLLVKEDWSCLDPMMSSTGLVEAFVKKTSQLVLPEKIVTVSDKDKPYMTEKLKALRRKTPKDI